MTHRADLHMHGPIGFQPYWLEKQGYAGKNLLQMLADTCYARGITICAVTSQEWEIPRGSLHDRLTWLREQYAPHLPRDYRTDTLGENILIVGKGEQEVYFVNGQTVNVFEDSKRFDHLVIGSNQVPNKRALKDTIAYARDHGLIQIAEHPFVLNHYGIGRARLLEHLTDFDAIEGFNAQVLWLCGGYNVQAKACAREYQKPAIAVSDAHRIEDAGLSHIVFYETLDTRNESTFFHSLKKMLCEEKFETVENFEPLRDWIRWAPLLQWGIRAAKKRLVSESAVDVALRF